MMPRLGGIFSLSPVYLFCNIEIENDYYIVFELNSGRYKIFYKCDVVCVVQIKN